MSRPKAAAGVRKNFSIPESVHAAAVRIMDRTYCGSLTEAIKYCIGLYSHYSEKEMDGWGLGSKSYEINPIDQPVYPFWEARIITNLKFFGNSADLFDDLSSYQDCSQTEVLSKSVLLVDRMMNEVESNKDIVYYRGGKFVRTVYDFLIPAYTQRNATKSII